LFTAGTLLGPSLWKHPFVSRAFAETIGDRYFIVLFLDGGNDGLNTVTPIANGHTGALRAAYESARRLGAGGLRLSESSLAPQSLGNDPGTGTPLGLHPGLAGIKRLYDLGKVAVVQGCGYPDYNLSHEQSRRIWETATASGSGSGWVGRYLGAAGYGSAEIPAVNVRGDVSGDFIQSSTSVIAVRRIAEYEFPYDYWYDSDYAAKRTCFQALYADAAGSLQPAVRHLGSTGQATLSSTDNYPGLSAIYEADRSAWDAAYEAQDNSTANGLREIAKVIYGVRQGASGVQARHFQLLNGGYDTHSNQGGASGQHNDLHREIGDAIELFYQDCNDMGVADKVCILVWSEFSRRIPQNDNGTDHGSQGPVFVIGGAVNGGLYGCHPDIRPDFLDDGGNTVYSQSAGNPYRSTDFRDVYGTLLKHWLNLSEAAILNPSHPLLTLDSGDPDLYWTAHNFDMGFL
jgi:uncharacterized protein (DUF1501 family)